MPVYLDDKRTAERILAGDERAFEAFFDDHFARLYRFAIVRLDDDPEAAREVAQSALARALRKMASYRAEAAMFTWLCAICRNEISDWRRRHQRYREHVLLVEDLPEVSGAIDSLQTAPDDGPEGQYLRLEAVRLIQVALDRLPARYGNVLEWKYVQGHSVREIAARLQIGTEATQSLLARAKRAFADVYGTLQEAAGNNDRLVES
jgi:RNA polymerase sigma-70 factor (ECF subfamily)